MTEKKHIRQFRRAMQTQQKSILADLKEQLRREWGKDLDDVTLHRLEDTMEKSIRRTLRIAGRMDNLMRNQ